MARRPTPAAVERAIYAGAEAERLPEVISGLGLEPSERDVEALLETVRAGSVIASYGIESARRGSSSPAARFGFLMHVLWEEGVPSGLRSSSQVLTWLLHSLVTLAAFNLESWSDQPHDRNAVTASFLSAFPISSEDVTRTGQLIRLGRRMAFVSGYRSLTHASRAQRPWAAIEMLNRSTGDYFDYSPYVARAAAIPNNAISELLQSPQVLAETAAQWVPVSSAQATSSPIGASRAVGGIRPPGPSAPPSLVLESSDRRKPGGDGGQITVWYGTDREPRNDNPSEGFTNSSSPTGEVRYGSCVVNVPAAHRFGTVGSSWWHRWTHPAVDDRLSLRAIDPCDGADDFAARVRAKLSKTGEDGRKTVFVYVHGYNTTFAQAAVRAAQLGFDLKVDGVTAFYSWPSAGSRLFYARDADTIDESEPSFTEFMTTIASKTGATNVDLVIHSMGNRLAARCLRDIACHLGSRTSKFGTIVLAAPDINVRLFRNLAKIYPAICGNTTMYVSERDKALALSHAFWKSDRAGFTPPVTVQPGIDTIEVTNIDVSRIGHGYYAESEPVLYDIRELFNGNFNPAKRLRLREVADVPSRYWRFVR